MSEAELQALITGRCDQLGLQWHHCRDGRTCDGEPGLPDLMIIGCRIEFWEIKSADGRCSRGQLHYHRRLRKAGARVRIGRPADWESGTIESLLLELVP